MDEKEKRWRVVIEGLDEYLNGVEAIHSAAEEAAKSVAQLNEALKELAELRKQTLL